MDFNPILNAEYIKGVSNIAFKIGSLEIAWYGIFMMIGFFLAIVAASLKLRFWYKVSYDPFLYFCLVGIPVSILGARLWSFIIGDAGSEGGNFFVEYWNFKQGGLAIQGGVVATVLAACIFFPLVLKRPSFQVKTVDEDGKHYVRQVSMWVYADAIVPCILIGQIIGRWGNFFNQEVYGAEVSANDLAWLKTIMPGVYDWMYIDGAYRQPLFLYESFVNFWFFLILYVGCEFIKVRKAGDLAILYFIFYGILRLCMEPLRASDFKYLTSIITSVLYIVVGIALIVLNHLVFSKNREFKTWFFIYQNICNAFIWLKLKTKNLHHSTLDSSKSKKSKQNEDEVKNGLMHNPNNPEINKVVKKATKHNPNYYRTKEEMLYYNGY